MMKKELAAALGISAAMVTKLARRGMPTDTPERAERWRRRHLEPGRVKGVRADTRPGGPPPELAMPGAGLAGANAIEGQDQAQGEANQGEAAPADFLASRARREAAEAAMAEMRLAEQRGELIRTDAVRHALAAVFTHTRDSLMQLPARMAQQLASEADPKAVQDLLEHEIHYVLTQLASGTPPALRPG